MGSDRRAQQGGDFFTYLMKDFIFERQKILHRHPANNLVKHQRGRFHREFHEEASSE